MRTATETVKELTPAKRTKDNPLPRKHRLSKVELKVLFDFYQVDSWEQFSINDQSVNDFIDHRRIRVCPHCQKTFFFNGREPVTEKLCTITGKFFQVYLFNSETLKKPERINRTPVQLVLDF